MTPTATILSPHLDDAVLSCWHVLTGPGEVDVLNVFAGSPPQGTAAPAWDALTGAVDPVERMRERAAEDRAALGLASRSARSLELLDEQYRVNGASPPDVVKAIRGALGSAAGTIYAPAALGGLHPDHELVRDAALVLAADGAEVRLYADLPHAARFGWPAWVTGQPTDPLFKPEGWWRVHLAAAGLELESLAAESHVLSEAEFARKQEAIGAYRSQLRALERLAEPQALRYEVVWSLEGAAR